VGLIRVLALSSLLLAITAGCYYTHLASGQMRLLLARESIDQLRADPDTPERLREQLGLVEAARLYATEIGLEVGGRYTSYVEWPGDRIVTTVVATRPGEVDAVSFDFPIVGSVPYKGFFDLEAAEREADALRDDGLDVCVVPVTAYSTLGWMDDPITAPMLRRDDGRLVETVVHELVHATFFVASQPAFNEGAARFVGQEAAVRFFADNDPASSQVRARITEDRTIADALLSFRDQVQALYAVQSEPEQRRSERDALEARFRANLAATPLPERDPAVVAERVRLNDACLALGGTYAADTTLHVEMLDALGGDLPGFVQRLRKAAGAEDPRAAFFDGVGLGTP
jgi:predicted aminopeptidase